MTCFFDGRKVIHPCGFAHGMRVGAGGWDENSWIEAALLFVGLVGQYFQEIRENRTTHPFDHVDDFKAATHDDERKLKRG